MTWAAWAEPRCVKRRGLWILAFASALGGCNTPGAGTTTPFGGSAPSTNSSVGGSTSEVVYHFGQDESWLSPVNPADRGEGGAPASGGNETTVPVPPYVPSVRCGDASVGSDEECDDGDGGSDGCTLGCQTRDQGVAPVPASAAQGWSRLQGNGRHPIAGGDWGFISVYVEPDGDEPVVGATVFNHLGQPQVRGVASTGSSVVTNANPVATALPNAEYAIAWNDFDGDTSELGVALRKVQADGQLGPLRAANGQTSFSQSDPDLLWTGTQLVVAWVDSSNAETGPDLRYRFFDADLNPLSDDQTLAGSALPEADVALAKLGSGFAAAYREGRDDGMENIVVWTPERRVRLSPPVPGGPIEDRPALVALDESHLLVAFSAGTPDAGGLNNIPRLRYAVVDVTTDAVPAVVSLNPMDDVLSLETSTAQMSPSLAPGKDGFYLSWRSEARPGDASGDEIWLKFLKWNATGTPALDAREPEMLIPRTCEGSFGDQRTPELAHTGLMPEGALAIAWDDYSHSQGVNSGDPDVVVHFAPIHPRNVARPVSFNETWKGSNGATWPSYWKTVVSGGVLNADIQKNEARVIGAPTGTNLYYLDNRTATNVEMVTKVRFNLNGSTAGLIARLDPVTKTFLAARFSDAVGDPYLRVYAAVDGSVVEIAATSLPYVFSYWAQNVDFYFKFRVETTSAGTTLSAKYWVVDVAEPAAWMVVGSLPANLPNTSPFYQAKQRLGNAAGYFGVWAATGINALRTVTFDDFRASYIDGAQLGNPTDQVDAMLPLRRAAAAFATCADGQKCSTAQGCCSGGSQCQTGLTCTDTLNDMFGLGSHAKTCGASHCTDNKWDADEVRPDCGGADCAACSCANTARGTPAYCTPTCPCGIGDADCAADTGCLPGLRCIPEKGYRYGWPQGSDACVPQHCQDRVQDGDELGVDWGGSCGPEQYKCFNSANGGYQHCTVSCPCGKGEGDCDYNDDCQTGMVCTTGTAFGKAFNVCVKAHCTNGVKDADETAKNCGGVDCAPCP